MLHINPETYFCEVVHMMLSGLPDRVRASNAGDNGLRMPALTLVMFFLIHNHPTRTSLGEHPRIRTTSVHTLILPPDPSCPHTEAWAPNVEAPC